MEGIAGEPNEEMAGIVEEIGVVERETNSVKGRWSLEEDKSLIKAMNDGSFALPKGRSKEQCRKRFRILQINPPVPRNNRLSKLDSLFPNAISKRFLSLKRKIKRISQRTENQLLNSMEKFTRTLLGEILDGDGLDFLEKLGSRFIRSPKLNYVDIAQTALIARDKNVLQYSKALLSTSGNQEKINYIIAEARKFIPANKIRNWKFGKIAMVSARMDWTYISEGQVLHNRIFKSRKSGEQIERALSWIGNHSGEIIPSKTKRVKVGHLDLGNRSYMERTMTLRDMWKKYREMGEKGVGRHTFYKLVQLVTKNGKADVAVDYFVTDIQEHFCALLSALKNLVLPEVESQSALVELTKQVQHFVLHDFSDHTYLKCSGTYWRGHCAQYSVGAPCICNGNSECRDCCVVWFFPYYLKKTLSEMIIHDQDTLSRIADLFQVLGHTRNVILGYLGHLMRRRIQDSKLSNLKQNLQKDECLLIMDWANKLLPARKSEASKYYFGKAGICFMGSVCITQEGSRFYDAILKEASSKTCETVLPILYLLLKQVKEEMPGIKRVHIQSDNAVAFNSFILFLGIFKMNKFLVDIEVSSIIFTEPQTGKSPTDVHFSYTKLALRTAVKHRQDAKTATQIYKILENKNICNMSLILVSNGYIQIGEENQLKHIIGEHIAARDISEVQFRNTSLCLLENSNLAGTTIDLMGDKTEKIMTRGFGDLKKSLESAAVAEAHFSNASAPKSHKFGPRVPSTSFTSPPRSSDKVIANELDKFWTSGAKFIASTPLKGHRFDKYLPGLTSASLFQSVSQILLTLRIMPNKSKKNPNPQPKTELLDWPLTTLEDIFFRKWASHGIYFKKNLALPEGASEKIEEYFMKGEVSGKKMSSESAYEALLADYSHSLYAQIAITETCVKTRFSSLSQKLKEKEKKRQKEKLKLKPTNWNMHLPLQYPLRFPLQHPLWLLLWTKHWSENPKEEEDERSLLKF